MASHLNNVPVLLIIFNRLDTTRKVLNSLKEVKPKFLFIAADGPRLNIIGESERCEKVRNWVLENVDWDCEVKTLFRKHNLGCGYGPANAISWFFDNVKEGIILEDDCVPDTTFFEYCSILLEKYRDDNRISIISGTNIDKQKYFSPKSESYFFSVFPLTWGWATWKRNWDNFDFQIKKWNDINQRRLLRYIFKEKEYHKVWEKRYNQTYKNPPPDIWDYQFFFSSFLNRQLSIIPNRNLISNIGHDNNGTHTIGSDDIMGNLSTYNMDFPLVHPKYVKRNFNYDRFLQISNYGVIEKVPFTKIITRWIKNEIFH